MTAMADFDFQVLQKLLLDDDYGAPTSAVDDHADYMEIDDPVFELDSNTDISTPPQITTSTDTRDAQEIPPDHPSESSQTLIALVLSPTRLGARLAISRQRLLMPPGPVPNEPAVKDPTPEYDYEFDISNFKSESLVSEPKQGSLGFAVSGRAMSPFGSYPQHTMPINGETFDLPAYLLPSGYPQNNRGLQLLFPASVSSLQIHHHHYYPDVRQRRVSVNESSGSPRKVSGSKRGSVVSSSLNDCAHDKTPPQLVITTKPTQLSPILPSPWEQQIHPAQPHAYVLWSYVQLALNTSVAVYALYLGFRAVEAVRVDISDELRKEGEFVKSLQAACQALYTSNQCDDPVPLQQEECEKWARCMHQYSGGGFRVQTLAHMIGMVVARLVEPLSTKVFMFLALMLFVAFAFNFSFGYIRAKSYYGTPKLA